MFNYGDRMSVTSSNLTVKALVLSGTPSLWDRIKAAWYVLTNKEEN